MVKKVTAKKPTKTTASKAKPAAAKAKNSAVSVDGILKQLKSLGDEKVRKHNTKVGMGDNQFGVPRGEVRKVANKIKMNHELALALWKTGNADAQFLATLIIDVKQLSADEMERLVKTSAFVEVADWLHSYVLKLHPDKETLRQKWMTINDKMAARAGWQLTAGRAAKSPEGLDLVALLDRVEKEMPAAPSEVQWTMNAVLAEIGINHPKLRKRALAIGEKLGVYRDYPCSKGCTSPFAPIWINEMVKRKG